MTELSLPAYAPADLVAAFVMPPNVGVIMNADGGGFLSAIVPDMRISHLIDPSTVPFVADIEVQLLKTNEGTTVFAELSSAIEAIKRYYELDVLNESVAALAVRIKLFQFKRKPKP